MADAPATVRRGRRISPVWIVPLVALAIGAWMVVYTLQNQGPEVRIVFQTAEGVEAGKTKIRVRNVEVGIVEAVELGPDLESVVVIARLDKSAERLLRQDTQFWVVRPRVGLGGVSGVGTLLSGGYIRLAPGTAGAGRREFVGLEEPPITPVGTPGLHLGLVSDIAGSVGTGTPVLYKNFRVGRIESAELDVDSQRMQYVAFIDAPYDALVSSATRFWNASGVSLRAGADGVEVSTGSLESILVGGVAFGLPEGVGPGRPVERGTTFELYPDRASVDERPYRTQVEYVVAFDQSTRGLRPGAPVEYRGLLVGHVEQVLLHEAVGRRLSGEGDPIPVLVRIEPGRLTLPDSEAGAAQLRDVLERAVGNGLRATLATGNLLTGALFVSMDFLPGAAPAEMGRFVDWPTIPTEAGGLEGIQVQITRLLETLNALPLEATLGNVERLLADLDALLADESMQALPATLEQTLVRLEEVLASVSAESPVQARLLRTATRLDRTLESLRSLLETLDERPSALIFDRARADDPVPPAGTP